VSATVANSAQPAAASDRWASYRQHSDLWWARGLTLGAVVLGFPIATIAVFGFEADRKVTADAFTVVFSFGLFLAFTTSLWPLPSLKGWSRARRVESSAVIFMLFSYGTHLTWELGWLVLHEPIAASRDAAWAYPWWAYIDGGDLRYATAGADLLMMETLSVINGVVGLTGLRVWFKSGRTDRRGPLLCMATAVVHLYSVSLYYGGEIIAGLPNVGDGFIDIWLKFGLANAPWAVFPWFVLAWGWRQLAAHHPPD